MDMRTGRMYESPEAARADGVPESDIAEVTKQELIKFFREAIKVRDNPKYPVPHQGERERLRHLKTAAKTAAVAEKE
jgi:hypothetical protein